MNYPKSFNQLVDSFAKYPGIGNKTAQRLAFFTMDNMEQVDIDLFCESLLGVKKQIKKCPTCGCIMENECLICDDTTRDTSVIMVVENIKDLFSFESMGQYKGLYHVLGGVIDFSRGKGPEDINVDALLKRLHGLKEIILATSGTVEGELTAKYLQSLISDKVITTRLAYGLPVGSNFEYLDEQTLMKAIEGRKRYE